MLLTVDPGKHSFGWARFDGDTLMACGMAVIDEVEGMFGDLSGEDAIVEKPQIYTHDKMRGDPNDLIDVAITAGAVGGVLSRKGAHVAYLRPHRWKGSRPKNVDNAYTLERMRPHEKFLLERCGVTKHKRHNVVDAIGIGLWKLGRRP